MKYIKLFEEKRNGYLEVGDWVICTDIVAEKKLKEFVENHIGRLVIDEKKADCTFPYFVIYGYEDVPDKLRQHFDKVQLHGDPEEKWGRFFSRTEILYFSKNKEDLEMILTAKKYNL